MLNIYSRLKSKLLSIKFVKRIYLRWKVNYEISNCITTYSSLCKKFGFKVKDTNELKEILNRIRSTRGDRLTCNIIGSGISALTVLDQKENKAANFTCNFGGLLNIPIDLYLIEFASNKKDKMFFSELQKKVVFSGNKPKILIVKNIWEGKLNKNYLADNYKDYYLLRDILFPNLPLLIQSRYYSLIFNKMFDYNQFFILQVYTSIITLIQLAVMAGYKKINVYGLDGKGSHFFHENFQFIDKELIDEIRERIPKVDPEEPHIVGHNAREFISPMSEYLKKKGVELTLK